MNARKVWDQYRYLARVAGGVLLVDQITKAMVRGFMPLEATWSPWSWLRDYILIVHWKNSGSAFGFLQGGGTALIVLSFIVAGLILFYFPRISIADWSLRLSLCLLMGGILGNLVDRLIFGHVTDFISILSSYYVFNLADISNLFGVIILVIGWLIDEIQRRPDRRAGGTDSRQDTA